MWSIYANAAHVVASPTSGSKTAEPRWLSPSECQRKTGNMLTTHAPSSLLPHAWLAQLPLPQMAEHKASHYAILIGINSYDSETGTSLRGCVPDVQEITKLLKQSCIEGLSIYRFTASLQPGSSQPTEPKEQWPTYDNIRSRICAVIQDARRGDHVYIHFSGHSTKVPPKESHSNWDTGDLALVVRAGPDASEERYFHGRELAEHLRDMVDKGVGVTIVLDCCYSGSTPRNDEVVRYVLYRPEVDERYPPKAKAAQLDTIEPEQSTPRGKRLATLIPDWLANPEGYTILTSSDATERAYDIKLDKSKNGLRHGTLTYFLLTAFDALGGVGGGMYQLHQHICVRIADHRRHHKTKTQSPVLFGNKAQLFFGLAKPGCSGHIPVTRITDRGTTGFRLHAGAAHGISEGDQFTLGQFRHDVPATGCAPVTAEAISVRGVTTDLRITGANGNAVETGWLATAITRRSLRQFPVRLSVGQAYRSEWRDALQQRLSLAECDEDDMVSASGWSFMVASINDTGYEIRDNRNQPITRFDVVESPERTRQQILSQLRHLASFKLVRDLTNRATDEKTLQFKKTFSVVLKDNKGKLFKPGCKKTGDLHEVCPHPECRLTLTPADKVTLTVRNEVNRDGPRLIVHVYAMGSGWEVAEMTKSSGVVLPPLGSDGDGPKATGVFQKQLRFPLKEGQQSCEEALKIFLTKQPTSFITLELPRLGESVPSRVEAEMSGNRGPLWESEDWAALTFQIRVVSDAADM